MPYSHRLLKYLLAGALVLVAVGAGAYAAHHGQYPAIPQSLLAPTPPAP